MDIDPTMDIRLASEAPFPYGSDHNSYFVVDRGKPVPLRWSEVKELVRAGARRPIYGVWPGKWRSDLFVLDNVRDQLDHRPH